VRLQPAPVAEMKMRGVDLFVTTGGFTNLGMDIVCHGARAAVRLNAAKPVLFVRGTGSSKDAMLVRMTQKKDSRTFQTSSADVSVENKSGFKKGDIRKVVVTEYPDHFYVLLPEEDLDPGEYLLVFGSAANSFDFGIDRQK